jgi:AraC family transcriptional regulator of arabinose operon
MDRRIKRVIELLQLDLRRPPGLDELAREVNLSSSRLRHLFKAETGASPALYLRRLRMEAARELGEGTFLSVKEIMHTVGLNNQSQFTKTFKRAHGLTPAQLLGTRRPAPRHGAGAGHP